MLFFNHNGLPLAIMSRSTADFRLLLSTNAIRYSMPLRREIDDELEMDCDSELRVDGTTEACLVIRGRSDVHGLFEVLINKQYSGDVPVLVSRSAFKNATLQMPSPSFNQTAMGGAKELQESHVAEFTGLFMPTQIATICEVMRRRVQTRFDVRFWTDGVSAGLNHCLVPEFAEVATAHECIGLSDPVKPIWRRIDNDATLTLTRVVVSDIGDILPELEKAPTASIYTGAGLIQV